jgi:hypothetical protein
MECFFLEKGRAGVKPARWLGVLRETLVVRGRKIDPTCEHHMNGVQKDGYGFGCLSASQGGMLSVQVIVTEMDSTLRTV